jgi:NADH:ubiquinone oxidoreductase subunit H
MSVFVPFFFGGWLPVVNIFFIGYLVFLASFKINFFFSFVWVQAAFPRYRYDQLMTLGWKVFYRPHWPGVILVSGTLISFDWLP